MSALSAKFLQIPTGNVVPVISKTRLIAPFIMEAEFSSETGDCSEGEYHQYVKGRFLRNEKIVDLALCGATLLKPDELQEDGCPPPCRSPLAYGYRTCPGVDGTGTPNNNYSPAQKTGCKFLGQDTPGISANPGDIVEMDLSFVGQLIDISTGKILAQAEWTVKGSGVIVDKTLVTQTPKKISETEQLSAVLRKEENTDIWDVNVLISRSPIEKVSIFAKELEVVILDDLAKTHTLLSRPEGNLIEAGNSRAQTLNASFQFAAKETEPKQIEVYFRNQQFRFDLVPSV